MCFYDTCLSNGIKPIIGLKISIGENHLYLYAQDYQGYQNLLKINTIKENGEINLIDLKKYDEHVICVLPFKNYSMFFLHPILEQIIVSVLGSKRRHSI